VNLFQTKTKRKKGTVAKLKQQNEGDDMAWKLTQICKYHYHACFRSSLFLSLYFEYDYFILFSLPEKAIPDLFA
jgi:hypothetical protein